MRKNSVKNIEITEQNIKAFSVVAKKYDIDYALKKDPTTEPPHYYVFFKAKDKEKENVQRKSLMPLCATMQFTLQQSAVQGHFCQNASRNLKLYVMRILVQRQSVRSKSRIFR